MNNNPTRGPTEFMTNLEKISFHPSVKACSIRKCPHLVVKDQSGVWRKVCGVNSRIPGNLSECPLDAAQNQSGTLYNSISGYNSLREIAVTQFNDKICASSPFDRGEVQEIISSIVKAARLNGYQIAGEKA